MGELLVGVVGVCEDFVVRGSWRAHLSLCVCVYNDCTLSKNCKNCTKVNLNNIK